MNLKVQCLYGSELMPLLEVQQDHLRWYFEDRMMDSSVSTHLLAVQKLVRRDLFMKSDSVPEGKRLCSSSEMD